MNTVQKLFDDECNYSRIHVGEKVQLEPVVSETPVRYVCRVLGYLSGSSLIVTAPEVHGKLALLRQDQQFNVRMLSGSAAQGFVSAVLAAPVKPYPHVHLAFPKAMESVLVRNTERVECDLVVAVQLLRAGENAWFKAHMLDLSVGGGLLRSTRPLAKVGEGLRLMLELPSLDGDEQMTLAGIVRNHEEHVEKDGRSVFHSGVEFRNLNRLQRLFIHAFVQHRVLCQRT